MKGKFYIVVVLVGALVGVTAWYGNQAISSLLQSLQEEVRPNERRQITQKILFDIQVAENSMNAFILDREATNLEEYYRTVTTIDRQLKKVADLNKESEEYQKLFRTLSVTVERKFALMDQLIELRNDRGTEEVLEKVLEEYDRLATESDSLSLPSLTDSIPDERQGIFGRLLQRLKQRRDSTQITQLDSVGTQVDSITTPGGSASIKDLIQEIQTDQQSRTSERTKKEIELIKEDRRLNKRISQTISRMEEIDQQGSEDRARSAEALYNKTERTILLIFGAFLFIFGVLILIIFNDLRRLRESRQLLEEQRQKALYLADAKSEFLSRMSHELRTPLNALIGFGESLKKQSNAPEHLVQPIVYASRHLYTIVNDILDFSKLEAGKVGFEKVAFAPESELKQVVNLMGMLAEEKQMAITVEYKGPEFLLGDPLRYRQIVINLVGNALKFTPEKGHITIKAQFVKGEGPVVAGLTTEVIDTGIGIPPEKQKAIFDSFTQAGTETSRVYGGTGLGLSISKKLVELQEGSISVQSEEGKGSIFSFFIPMTASTQEFRVTLSAEAKKSETFEGRIVWVVDDEAFNRRLLRVMCEERGMTVFESAGGDDFLASVWDQRPDIILMDINMPGSSGFDILRSYRQKAGKVQVIACSAGVSEEEVERVGKAGFDGFLAKPVEEAALVELLRQAFGGEKRTEGKVEKPKRGKQLDDIEAGVAQLQRLSGGDAAFVDQMIALFIQEMDTGLLQMKEDFSRSKAQGVREVAHALCGPAAQLKLMKVYESLRQIEDIAGRGKDLSGLSEKIEKLSAEWSGLRKGLTAALGQQEKK